MPRLRGQPSLEPRRVLAKDDQKVRKRRLCFGFYFVSQAAQIYFSNTYSLFLTVFFDNGLACRRSQC